MLGVRRRWLWIGMVGAISLLSGCIFIGDYDDVYVEPLPVSIMYEVCYDDAECRVGFCEEVAVPISPYAESVSAICTHGCYDDLECPFSEFNGLPGACIDHIAIGGPIGARVCVERCEVDLDCDVVNGFGCALVTGARICVPIL